MIIIKIIKNDLTVRTFKCNKETFDKTLARVNDIASKMWNDRDDIEVIAGWD